jgi:hypothetical protein
MRLAALADRHSAHGGAMREHFAFPAIPDLPELLVTG